MVFDGRQGWEMQLLDLVIKTAYEANKVINAARVISPSKAIRGDTTSKPFKNDSFCQSSSFGYPIHVEYLVEADKTKRSYFEQISKEFFQSIFACPRFIVVHLG